MNIRRSFLPALICLTLFLGILSPSALALEVAPSLRVHYQNELNDYDDLGLWFWGDAVTPSEKTGAWPAGRTLFAPENITGSGAYADIALAENAAEIGVLVIDGQGGKRTPEDLMITIESPEMRDVWINDRLEVRYEDWRQIPDDHIRIRFYRADQAYTDLGLWFWGDVVTPSEKTGAWPAGATEMTPQEGSLGAYVDIELAEDAKELGFLFVNRVTGEQTADFKFTLDGLARVLYMKEGDDTIRTQPYAAPEAEAQEVSIVPWQEIDAQYYTDSPLGAALNEDGSATLRLWAPTAQKVETVIYSPVNPEKALRSLPMAQVDKGVWEVTLTRGNTPVRKIEGLLYQFRVFHGGAGKLVLDPYAKSMAAWNSGNDQGETVGKAAIIDPASIGPSLSFAGIPGFIDREDAIIYEAHIRDFTSDPGIEGELSAPYGTFMAFIDRLDYLKDLGVTHIQLLPVLSFYNVNELDRERLPGYASENQNYNWGYDPQSYFALSGMYATDPKDPVTRVKEFKQLVAAIHERGMGVILDVVYNHTAKIEILEDIQPNYYYFMDRNGKPKGSFGGGQVGSTHRMTRRLIVDSLVYLTDTYKVDGFRFDMMGNLDLDTLTQAYGKVSELNPQTLWIGEGWRTFNGDYGVSDVTPADQDAMHLTDAVSVFSDEVRNELKSGFGIEGQPRFLTGGSRPLSLLYANVTAQPANVSEDDPGDIVQYIEAHDNLTLHDVIALSIKKDPKTSQEEILRRQRLGNALLLTHQGIVFLHSGQEYGRTKQFRHPDYIGKVDAPPAKSTFMAEADGNPFEYPYFIHDSYDSSDSVNRFDWGKALSSPPHRLTLDYTRGLIALRRSTDAFSYANQEDIEGLIAGVFAPDAPAEDLLLSFTARSRQNGDIYIIAVNADSMARQVSLSELSLPLSLVDVLVDGHTAGIAAIENPVDVKLIPAADGEHLGTLELQPLTAAVLRVKTE